MDPTSPEDVREVSETKSENKCTVVPINKVDTELIVPSLEALLEKARAGQITDYIAIYYDNGEPSYSVTYRHPNRLKLIGLLEAMKAHLVSFVSIE